MTVAFPPANNIGLLRLCFALQVAVMHAVYYLRGYNIPYLENFPGVPAFFFLSGFLVYASYEHSGSLRDYAQNRILRIYPALFAVSLVSLLALIFIIKGVTHFAAHWQTYLLWFSGEVALGHVFTPEIFRDVGTGAINSPLWSVTVELQFYLLVPLLHRLERRSSLILPLLMACSFAFYAFAPALSERYTLEGWGRGLGVLVERTPLAWGWMFGLGILSYRHFERLRRYLPYFKYAAVPLVLMILANAQGLCWMSTGNNLGLGYYLCYVMLVLYAAFALPPIKLGFDLSYGIYIWNMPVVNLFLVYGLMSPLAAMAYNVLFALLSWYAIEKPALRHKHSALKKP